VVKVDSDVNNILFEILPESGTGVIYIFAIFSIHLKTRNIGDENRCWKEIYVLRSFLEYNPAFRIIVVNTFWEYFHGGYFK
jgi:hypothetical protein